MRFVIMPAAIWAISLAPQLCWVGVLTACCADDAHQKSVSETADACAPGGCDRDCRLPSEEPATPAGRDCRTCQSFCGVVVKPADARERVSQLQIKLLAVLSAAISGDNLPIDAPAQYPLRGRADSPRLPCPSSDFPLLL